MGCHFLLQGIFPTQGWNHIVYISCIGSQALYLLCHLVLHLILHKGKRRGPRSRGTIPQHSVVRGLGLVLFRISGLWEQIWELNEELKRITKTQRETQKWLKTQRKGSGWEAETQKGTQGNRDSDRKAQRWHNRDRETAERCRGNEDILSDRDGDTSFRGIERPQ